MNATTGASANARARAHTHPEDVPTLDTHALQGGVRGDSRAQQRRNTGIVRFGESFGNFDHEVAVNDDGPTVASVGRVALDMRVRKTREKRKRTRG
jgi:hypothetical protein